MKQIGFFLYILLFAHCAKEQNTTLDDDMGSIPTPTSSYSVLKSGKFNGASGYPANGTAQLVKDSTNMYSIVLEQDFSTTYATGSVTMYLSKTPIPTFEEATTFIKLAVINKNGFHRFALASRPADQLVNVVVWCQPAGVKFGHAEIK
ncbi:MAG: DM13 domain-containing protein [Saprospiraceae bacterium]|nr:DM13 domain-containing protein [Saprospiraceae bacterium]